MTSKYIKAVGWISVITGLSLLGTSCKMGNKYPKEVAVLDSLKVQVHKADSVITAVDTAKIKQCNAHITGSIGLLKMLHRDTMSAGAAEVFRNFSGIRWSMEGFLGKRAVMRTEMQKSIDNLTHLGHDMKNGLIKADSVSFYYNFEVKRATELIEVEHISMQTLNSQLPLYTLVAPQADSLIALVKQNKKI